MSDNFESSLINLGELSKPATVLIEKISEAVGGTFKPYQIVRVAKAEAQADRITGKRLHSYRSLVSYSVTEQQSGSCPSS